MSNATFSNSTGTSNPGPAVQVTDNGGTFGYQCARVVKDNTVTDIPVTFFLDIAYPPGAISLAISYLQQQLVKAVAAHYGISNGSKCDNPSLDGSTWLVQILSSTKNWTRETIFKTCQELKPTNSSDDCFVYQATLTGGVLGTTSMPDVITYIETVLNNTQFTAQSPYQIQFLGLEQANPQSHDIPGGAIPDASKQATPTSSNRSTVTIVGGFLVVAFCIAFLGIGFILWRRRQEWLQQQAGDLQLFESDFNHPRQDPDGKAVQARDGIHPSHDEDYDDLHRPDQIHRALYGNDEDRVEIDTHGNVRRVADFDYDDSRDDDPVDRSNGRKTMGAAFPKNKMTFDLGTSFKDQLMGVHAPQKGARPSDHMLGGMYGVGRGMSSDGAESDADSWAQTDGTIGSLEGHLEPITAEV